MNTLLIAFDFHKLGPRYLPLRRLIRSAFPDALHPLEGTYLVSTESSATQVREFVKQVLSDEDELLIVALERGGWTWRSNSSSEAAWLREYA